MNKVILNESIVNKLHKKGWLVVTNSELTEGYDVVLSKDHAQKHDSTVGNHRTKLFIKGSPASHSYVKFLIHTPKEEVFFETEDLLINSVDERIIAVASELFKQNKKRLQKQGVLSKGFF